MTIQFLPSGKNSYENADVFCVVRNVGSENRKPPAPGFGTTVPPGSGLTRTTSGVTNADANAIAGSNNKTGSNHVTEGDINLEYCSFY